MTATRSAEEAAEELLAKHGFEALPVDVEQLVQLEGAQLVRENLDRSISGMLIREESVVLLAVNSGNHPRRQRFTIAHELGHLLLHPGRQHTVDSTVRVNFRDDVSSRATDSEEIEANAFAAALLMPAVQVRASLQRFQSATGNPGRVVSELAEQFGVSAEAMGYRLINLGLST
ncbi:MAG: ImmA/IrrE family metallo-endopeptidase [Actinomycetota bacterium]|nr:ImmA/IrrE family metallo-endopeptidase [Actinomycetota bacterium]MDP1877499.1 ImmA/IrrE family metallo-endopeptidase [Actinomycetota bacterium]